MDAVFGEAILGRALNVCHKRCKTSLRASSILATQPFKYELYEKESESEL